MMRLCAWCSACCNAMCFSEELFLCTFISFDFSRVLFYETISVRYISDVGYL